MTQRRLKNGEAEKCPIRDILDRIGDRWSMLVLWSLARGTLRFSELKRNIGDISQRMLAQTLRRLEQDGLISRRIYPTVPPRVDYSLTPLGRSFLAPLDRLVKWADRHHARIRAARAAYATAAAAERNQFVISAMPPRQSARSAPAGRRPNHSARTTV